MKKIVMVLSTTLFLGLYGCGNPVSHQGFEIHPSGDATKYNAAVKEAELKMKGGKDSVQADPVRD